jgi:hypothetical protein
MAKIVGRWKLKTDANGKTILVKPARKLDVSARLRQKNSKKTVVVSPGRAALRDLLH